MAEKKYPDIQTMRDPAGATRLILKYEKEILEIIELLGRSLAEAVREVKMLEIDQTPTRIDHERYASIIAVHNEQAMEGIRRIIVRRSQEGYFQGVTFAKQRMKPYGIDVSFKMPYDDDVIKIIRENNERSFKGLTEDMSKEIRRQVSEGAMQGETIDQISKRVVGVSDTIGVSRARMIARTELMKGVNEAVRRRYASSGVEKMKRIETKDERTCTNFKFNVGGRLFNGCQPAALGGIGGVVFTLAEATELDIQTHPNCRGTWVPYFEELMK